MYKKSFYCLLITMIIGYLLLIINQNLQTERNNVTINVSNNNISPTSLNVAVIGDIHLSEDKKALQEFKNLLQEVKRSSPDLVLFLGDYIAKPSTIQDITKHRKVIIIALKQVDPIPRAVILGNYESWSNANDWLLNFQDLEVDVLENKVSKLKTKKGIICIRGLGDMYTKRYRYIDYPEECKGLPKITITHDPAGAFDNRMKGLIIAGHTHCGQISLPIIGPLWVPSNSPSGAHCGLYKDNYKILFVTSGVGTSILPIRFGTQSQWDMLKVNFQSK